MFELITKAKPGELRADTIASLIRAGLHALAMSCRELRHVAPMMSQVQRNQLRIELCEAVAALDVVDGHKQIVDQFAAAGARADAARAVEFSEQPSAVRA